MEIKKIYLNWSSGKDSALALYYLLQNRSYAVDYLLTSVNAFHNRVSMHGLRRDLLLEQVQSIGIPHGTIDLPEQPSNEEYEALMKNKAEGLKAKGFEYAGFGDIFLEDLRKYREEKLSTLSIRTVFPLWKKDTHELLNDFIEKGFKAIVICINADVLPVSFIGRVIDKTFISDLPEGVDVCGENGEFHTFCFDGPIFNYPVKFSVGETVFKEYDSAEKKHGFWFLDLLPLKE
ncbi:ATP-binding protein [Sphingobacteriaceae bacterium]|nr:ATP-binding protein [Sphingobacteriaceae bacterium]